MSIKDMTLGKIKKVFKDEETSNKTVFSIAVAVLIAILGFGGLQLMVAGRDTGYGYGYGYDGTYGYGYQQYNPNPVAATQPNGRLVKASDADETYVLLEGEKHWIPSVEVFRSQGYKWADVYTTTVSSFANGTDVKFREGSLVKETDAPETYVIEETNGTYYKKHIASITVFKNLGYSWSQVQAVSDLSGYATGSQIASATTQPDGRLVKEDGADETYVIKNGLLSHIISLDVFRSQGYKWANVYVTDLSTYLAGTDTDFREGSLVRQTGTNPVYVTDYLNNTYYKRHITTPSVFSSLGFDWADVRVVDDISTLTTGTTLN